MGIVSESAVSLRFVGDTLDPREVTRLLGAEPDDARVKGDTIVMPSGGKRIAPRGIWSRRVEPRKPADVPGQIAEILAPLSAELAAWHHLASRYRAEIFCGLFVEDGNHGLSLPPETLELLADRHLTIDFDVYSQ
jgi:hypothetical protein